MTGVGEAGSIVLIDEQSARPVRAVIGSLLERADAVDFAVTRIRLGALDLTAHETAAVRRCRVLLGRLDVGMLVEAGDPGAGGVREEPTGSTQPGASHRAVVSAAGERAARLEVLAAFAASGRLEVRSAGFQGWVPDFSIYRGAQPAALVGAHYFGTADPVVGPSFTTVLNQADALALLEARFDELWQQGHDVLPAIRDVLERAHALAMDAAVHGGGPDRPGAAG